MGYASNKVQVADPPIVFDGTTYHAVVFPTTVKRDAVIVALVAVGSLGTGIGRSDAVFVAQAINEKIDRDS